MTLAATLERLARVDPWFGADVGVPDGPGWFRFDDLTAESLGSRVDALAGRHGGHRDVAGSYLGGWLAGAAIVVPVACLVLEERLPDPAAAFWVHEHDEGWFDRIAYDDGTTLIVGDDDGIAAFAAGLASRLSPVFDSIRSLTPFGRRGLWGSVADGLAGTALWAARAGGTVPAAAWDTAAAVTDAVATHVPSLRTRPSPCPVAGTLWSVKGTCCLFHKTQPQPPDPCGESYCTTCPFRDERSRHERLVKLT